MEILSKENFWNELNDKYPKGLKVFCDWIDEYKARNLWGIICMDGVKYHDLPPAMQIGIYIEFVCDKGGCSWEIEDMFDHDWEQDIAEHIKFLHHEEIASSI